MRYFKVEFIDPMCDVTFLFPNKKVTKEVVRGEALRAKCRNSRALATGKRLFRFAARSTTRPGPHSRRVSHRPLKMSRFSAGSAVKTCRFVTCKRSKIGTFLNAGWRCGGVILKRGAFMRSALLSRLLLALFLPKQEKGEQSTAQQTEI